MRRDDFDRGSPQGDFAGELEEIRGILETPRLAAGKRTRTQQLPSPVHRDAERADVPDPDAAGKVAGAASASGQPLPEPLKVRLEESLGSDLGDVRVHTGTSSAEAAAAVGARAYASGQDIHFAAGMYDPDSTAGQRLIAHEVAHTVQQKGAASAVQGDLGVSQPGDAHEVQAESFAQAFIAGGTAPVTAGSTGADTGISRDAEFRPTFGGDAGAALFPVINEEFPVKASVSNARRAPTGTEFKWKWGAIGSDAITKVGFSPDSGASTTAKFKPTKFTAAEFALGIDVEVTEPSKPATTHPVKPGIRVSMYEPKVDWETKVLPGPKGGGSGPTALRPGDTVELRGKLENIHNPSQLTGAFTGVLTQMEGLYLTKLQGVDIANDQPFIIKPYRFEGNDAVIFPVQAHHAGGAKYKVEIAIPGAPKITKEFNLKTETSLAFFLERCNAATNRHRALTATFDAYLQQCFRAYKAGYEAAKAALDAQARREALTREILLGVLFAGLGGALGGAVGGVVKASMETKFAAEVVKKALAQSVIGAVTDAPKDIVKYTVRLGRRLGEGSTGRAPSPDDATPDPAGGTGGAAGGEALPGGLDPLDWYSKLAEAKAKEEARIALIIEGWQTSTQTAINNGSEATVDFDPINAVTDITKLGDKQVTALGSAPPPEHYEKQMWEAWISAYAFKIVENASFYGRKMGFRAQDNIGKDLREEMERVRKVLAAKGVDASWLEDAIRAAQANADAEARRKSEEQRNNE